MCEKRVWKWKERNAEGKNRKHTFAEGKDH